MEEAQAIQALKTGDLAGLEHLVRHHQVEAVQAAYLIVADRPLAQDIAQAAFLKAAERIHQFQDGRPFRPWFLRIVTNDAIKACTRATRLFSLDEDSGPGLSAESLLDPSPGPEDLADTAENRRMVWHALQQLTPKQRAAIVMRYYLDMKEREISAVLGTPLGRVKWALHAARERLRTLLVREPDRNRTGSRACSDEHPAGEGR